MSWSMRSPGDVRVHHSGVAAMVGRVQLLYRLPAAEVHVHAAGQARVEAADGPHDVDALEVLPVVLLEQRLSCTASSYGPGVP
jgi:hypothetical protein